MKPTPSPLPSVRRLPRAASVLACLGLLAGAWGGPAQAQSSSPSQTQPAPAEAARTTPPPPDLSRMPEPAAARQAASRDKAPARRDTKPDAAAAKADPAEPPVPARQGATTTITQAGPGEPVVQRSVIEDEGSRIEETRVRGQLQRITVTPKVGSKVSYEILTGDGSGSEASRSTAGKRVWNVLQF